MTPALLTLSRAYMAILGAPTVPAACRDEEHAAIGHYRAEDGARWVFVPEAGYEDIGAGEWLLDLDDAATGGALLDRLGSERWRICPGRNGWDAYTRMDLDHRAGLTETKCATLAEAVARVCAAAGRAG